MLNKFIKKDSETFPYFLSNQFTSHMEAMSSLFDIFRATIQLNVAEFLTERQIEQISQYIHQRFIYIKDVLEATTYLKCLDYYRFKLYLYIDHNLQLENYEQVSNMQEVAEILFNKKFNLNEDDEQDYEDSI